MGFGVCCGMDWGRLDFELVWIKLVFEVGWVGRGLEWIMGLFACRGVGLGMGNGRGGQSGEDALLEGLGFGVCCVGRGFGMGGDGLGFGVC